MLAYPLLILALTHSAVLAGVVGTAREIALIGLQLPAGTLSDRLDRRLTMIICDTMRAVMLALLGVLIALDLASWPVVLVVSVIEGGASAIFTPARTWGAGLAGPVLGGILFGPGRAVPFLADALSYGISFGTVSRIRGRFRPAKPAGRKPLWREAADGLRFAWQVPILRGVMIRGPLVNFAFNGVLFTIILAMRRHGSSAVVIGLVQAAIMAGGVVGGVAAPRLQRRLSVRRPRPGRHAYRPRGAAPPGLGERHHPGGGLLAGPAGDRPDQDRADRAQPRRLPRAATAEHRLAACISDCGPYDLSDAIARHLPGFLARQLPDGNPALLRLLGRLVRAVMNKPTAGWAMRRNLMAHGLNDPLECFKIAPQYSLKGIEDRISCPTFVCSAGDDDLSVDAGKLYDALTCPKRYYQFPSAKAPGSTAKAAPGPCSTPSPSTGSARCSTPPRACRLRN